MRRWLAPAGALIVPFIPGRNYADLYEVVFPSATGASRTPGLLKPRLIKTANKQFDCREGYCNMDAAASLDVDPVTQSLDVYAAAGWLDDGAIKFTVHRGARPSMPGLIRPGSAPR